MGALRRHERSGAVKEKAAAAKGKGKLGRKRKSAALEAEAGSLMLRDEVARMSEVEPEKALGEPWRALVARMY